MKHWYISYYCVNHTSHYGVTTTTKSPAQWSIDANKEYTDGPYIILYAEEVTREQAEYIQGYMA